MQPHDIFKDIEADEYEKLGQGFLSIILRLSVVQQSMRVTRRIVLTHLTKVLYEFGCFKEKVWSFLKIWIWQLLFY